MTDKNYTFGVLLKAGIIAFIVSAVVCFLMQTSEFKKFRFYISKDTETALLVEHDYFVSALNEQEYSLMEARIRLADLEQRYLILSGELDKNNRDINQLITIISSLKKGSK